MPQRIQVVFDTDPGVDDALALAIAARSPELEVVGVSATFGNASVARTYVNARRILELAGARQVPVVAGADRPLRLPFISDQGRHGPHATGLAPAAPLEPVRSDPAALLGLLERVERPVTLVTLGPLTNLAHALERDAPLVHRWVARLVCVAGCVEERAAPDRWADFNAWSDPDAADRVLHAGLPLELLPLDVTKEARVTHAVLNRWDQSTDPLARWLAAAFRHPPTDPAAEAPTTARPIHDALAIAALLHPAALTLAEARLVVDLDEGPRRGHTRRRGDGSPARVVTEVAAGTIEALLARVELSVR